MRSLLCGLLSIVLFVNSITPAYADILPVGRAVTNAGTQVTRRLPTLLGNAGGFAGQTAATQELINQMMRQAANIQRTLPHLIQYRQWVEQSNLARFVADGKYQGVAQRILSLTPKEQEPLLRNEFVLLTLLQQVSTEQLLSARNLLRADLVKKQTALKAFSDTPLSQIIETQSAEAKACQEAFSDAAALALTGGPQDAEALISFYNAAAGTAFEPVATRLVGRGLLRWGAYRAFTQWSKDIPQEGEFWLGLSAYARQNNLPVFIRPDMSKPAVAEPDGLIAWLEQGNLANGLNADGSLAATKQWMSIGVPQPAARAAAPTAKTADLPGAAGAPAVQPDLTNTSLISSEPGTITPSSLPTGQNAGTNAPGNVSSPYASVPQSTNLYDNRSIRPVYQEEGAEDVAVEADDVYPLSMSDKLEVAESGFKLTFEDETGVERILPNVNLVIDASLETEGYNRVALRSDNIFELRNGNKPAGKMSHFIFTLSYDQGELYTLAQRVSQLFLFRPMRIKLERKPNARYKPIFLEVADFKTGKSFNIQAIVDSKLLPKDVPAGSKILLAEDGKIYFAAEGAEPIALNNFYVRLPKGEAPAWMAALQNDGVFGFEGNNVAPLFNLHILPTENKAWVMTNITSPLRVGFAKAAGPIFKALGYSSFWTTALPLAANNCMPVLLGPLMPYLRRYGDANMYRLGVAMVAAAFTGAVAIGLNGFIGLSTGAEISPLIRYGLPGVLFVAGFGGTLMNTPQNNLVKRNAGVVSTAYKTKGRKFDPTITPTFKRLQERFLEVFATKDAEETDSSRNQKLSLAKNFGSAIFWSSPFLFNMFAKMFGSSLEADFSLGFSLFAPFAVYALYKIARLPLKDSTPRNTAVLHNMVIEVEHNLIPQLQKELEKSPEEWDFQSLAKDLNDALTPYTRGMAYKLKQDYATAAVEMEGNSLNRLKTALTNSGVEEDVAQQALTTLQKALAALGHRDVSLLKVLKMPGVIPALLSMIGLTIHELGGSSEFAFQVNELIKRSLGIEGNISVSALGLAISAIVIYGSSWVSRYAGNWLARRISEGSMYAFSSSMSVLGTAMMIGAGDSLGTLLTGATLAMFGMGNFFAQLWVYTMKQAPEYSQELAVLIGYTMPIAAVLSACVHTVSDWGASIGIDNLGLITTMGALLASLAVCPGIFRESTITASAQYYGRRAWNGIKKMFGFPPSSGTNGVAGGANGVADAAAAGAH